MVLCLYCHLPGCYLIIIVLVCAQPNAENSLDLNCLSIDRVFHCSFSNPLFHTIVLLPACSVGSITVSACLVYIIYIFVWRLCCDNGIVRSHPPKRKVNGSVKSRLSNRRCLTSAPSDGVSAPRICDAYAWVSCHNVRVGSPIRPAGEPNR